MRLYYCGWERTELEAIIRDGFMHDKPLYRSEEMARAAGWNPSGVSLTDDPVLSYEHGGAEVLRVELDAEEADLASFEDLSAGGFTTEVGALLERAWLQTGVPMIGTTYRHWVVPSEWLRQHVKSMEIVLADPEELWEEVARHRRPRADPQTRDEVEERLRVLARAVHGRRFDPLWGIERDEDRRIGTLAIQESMAVLHFDRLVEKLASLDVPLSRCGWLLAEAARRVAIDSHRLSAYVRQKRAARWKTEDAQAQDDPEVKKEAVRLKTEGVPVAKIRRRLLARFGPDRVPSERVLRTRWLLYVFDRTR